MSAPRRLLLFAVLFGVLPGSAAAQLSLLGGLGISSPLGDFSDEATTGYHARLGVQVSVPTLPVALRADGDYHAFSAARSGVEDPDVLAGALSVVFSLPGVGLNPYLLGGVGRYRLEGAGEGTSASEIRNGFHIGFGVALGVVGLGGLAEIRFVQVDREVGKTRYVPLTIGLRL